jgi:hypothetical protein
MGAGHGLVVLVASILILGGCGTTNDVATNLPPIVPDASPQDLADVPQGLEEASLTIEGGRFAQRELILQQNQPTVLHVANHDGRDYQLQITPNLVDPTAVAATTVTQIEFTDPDAGTYQAKLLQPDTGNILATLNVEIETPMGNA